MKDTSRLLWVAAVLAAMVVGCEQRREPPPRFNADLADPGSKVPLLPPPSTGFNAAVAADQSVYSALAAPADEAPAGPSKAGAAAEATPAPGAARPPAGPGGPPGAPGAPPRPGAEAPARQPGGAVAPIVNPEIRGQ